MSKLATSISGPAAAGLLTRLWPRLGLLLALCFVLADAKATTCRLNDINGPMEYPLNVGTIEVPPPAFGVNYFWRSPLQSVQVVCETAASDYTDTPIVIHMFPRGFGLYGEVPNVGATIEYKGQTISPFQNFPVDTGYRTIAGQTRIFRIEYYVRFWHGADAGPTTPAIVNNVRLFSIHATADRAGTPPEHSLYQVLNGTFIGTPERTCELSVTDRNRSVRLPTIPAGGLSSATPAGGRVNFDLRLNNCSAAVNQAGFTFSGESDADSPDYFASQGTASGVAVRLGKRDDNQTLTPQGLSNVAVVPVVDQQAALPLFAEYYRTGEVTAGTVAARTEFTLSYQ